MFPSADGGFMDTSTYRSRVLKPLADSLGIPKLNFQVIRRTIATRAQSLCSVKDTPIAPAALASRPRRKRVHAGASGERATNGGSGLCVAQRRGFGNGELSICYQMLPIAFRQFL
jgi:hypothetical protein